MAFYPGALTKEQKQKALRAVKLIKQKCTGSIKGCMCANGAPHRKFVLREDARSPTLFLEALIMTLTIDAHERRKVTVFDVPGAYLQIDLPKDKFVLLMLEDQFLDIMCSINPKYYVHVRTEGGRKFFYLRIRKAIYGMVESAFLWYDLFVNALKDMGFVLNPYDMCVAIKTINGKQCTVAWPQHPET